ncbi:MAG: outer membrane beta-barrel protein [Myxococcota bacterium]
MGLAVLGVLAAPAAASAYENQVTLGLELGWAGIPNSSTLPLNGIDLGITAGYGINDAWEIRGLGTFNLLFDDDRLRTGMIGAEATYLLDIVRFVPVFGFGVDAVISAFRGNTRGDFAMHALLGVDFLINPRWLVGASARGFWVTTNGRSFLDALFFTAAFRVGIRFDVRRNPRPKR